MLTKLLIIIFFEIIYYYFKTIQDVTSFLFDSEHFINAYYAYEFLTRCIKIGARNQNQKYQYKTITF